MFSSYQQAVDALYQRINFESLSAGGTQGYSSGDFKLERMKQLLEAIGSPHQKIPAVHIAGTKGKGTTCTLVAKILQEAGYRVGLFTSPHLYRIEERLTINGKMPSPERFTKMVNQLMPIVTKLDQQEPQICATFFEIINAIAWQYFCEENVDLVVLEVGLGGRLDSTIFCQPLVTAITSISRDHTRILGDSLEEIAREKAGILKPKVPVICGVTEDKAESVIHQLAQKLQCPTIQLNRDFHFQIEQQWTTESNFQQIKYTTNSYSGKQTSAINNENSFRLKQPGNAIAQNASLAIAIIRELQSQQQFHVTEQAISQALLNASLALRFEIIAESPTIIVDSAHNEASIESVIETAKQVFPDKPLTIILSVSRDKDYVSMCKKLREIDLVIVTKYLGNQRALPVKSLRQAVTESSDAKVISAASPTEALKLAREQTSPNGVILATGSLFLAAEIRELLIP